MKNKLSKRFLLHLGIVSGLCLLLYGSFFATLHWFTRHGEEKTVPGVMGKTMKAAVDELQRLGFDVLIDSTYEPEFTPLSILKQIPDSGSVVKPGRTIFLTVNMVMPPRAPMPNVVGLSYRSAEMLLRNNKLRIGDTSYQPDIAAGAILEQRYNGKLVKTGEMIQQGSKIDLIIGNGLGNTEFDVPDVSGLSVEEALITLNQYNLQPIYRPKTEATTIDDTMAAKIVDQAPRALEGDKPNRIKMGDVIELFIE
jgi:beta-lactam-binding protein with PASTA domain